MSEPQATPFRRKLPTASWASDAAARKRMQANRSRDTGPELALRSELHRRGFRFRKNFVIRAGGMRTSADIVFTRPRLAVFVDGCFWHRCPEHATNPKANSSYWLSKLENNVRRDRRVDTELTAHGWKILRVWEHELPADAADRITAALTSAGTRA